MTRNFNDPDEPEYKRHDIRAGEEFCMLRDCRSHFYKGRYYRGQTHVAFTNARGERIHLCGYHYLVGLDAARKSVMSQLRDDPESIVSQVEAQLRHAREQEQHDADIEADMRALDQLEVNRHHHDDSGEEML